MVDQAERLREIVKRNKTTNSSRVIAITSGKGGVGKTNLAVNLSLALIKLGSRVLLVDADLGLANVDVMLGLVPRYNLGQVITGQCNINEIITVGPLGLRIIASGSADYKMANLSDRSIDFCLKQLNDIEKDTDIMIVDTGAGISRNVLKFVLAAGEAIVVTTPEPTAITDAYGVIKVIANSNPKTPIWLVVNMVKDEDEGQQVVERLQAVCNKFLGIELINIGFIPFDNQVSKAVKEQQPFLIGKPRSVAAQQVTQVAKNLMNRSANNIGTQTFFQRLFGGNFN
ncbi:MAG TPA: MinD/ParA family protein [Bacillota bacterium]|jgi:flagellar biosynthesis protein FlhG|nr:MinD/ParA family protein [Bacillota bacterium]HOL10030.1 MinD/ParA family protein [Bacillota bacterium]HPO97780.1 MinD/ParA family protein [Bacillota bacterium]